MHLYRSACLGQRGTQNVLVFYAGTYCLGTGPLTEPEACHLSYSGWSGISGNSHGSETTPRLQNMQYARFLRGAEAVNSGPPAYAKSTLTQRAISAFTELLNSHPRPHWQAAWPHTLPSQIYK